MEYINLSVRNATTGELRTIQDLNHELFIQDNQFNKDLNINWPYETEGETYFKACIENDDKLCVMAEVDDVIAGYLCAGIGKPHSAYRGIRAELENMEVRSEFRNQGIGTQLIDAYKQWAKEKNVDKLVVTAFSGNKDAVRFYEKNGFSEYAVKLWQEL